jgi:hypothetical protein
VKSYKFFWCFAIDITGRWGCPEGGEEEIKISLDIFEDLCFI